MHSTPVSPSIGFPRVLAAEVVSNFGSMLSRLVLPWLATLTLGATPLQMAGLLMADVIAGALGSLALGTLIDRLPKRAVMLASDAARAAVLAGLVALAAQQALSMPALVAAAALNGLFTVAFELARSAWMAQAIPDEALTRSNAQLSAGSSLSETAAFALGGWIFGGLGAVLALVVDAASYLLSALCLRGVKEAPPQPAPASDASPWQAWLADTAAGIAAVRADPALRTLAVLEILGALALSLGGTSYMIFVSRDVGFDTGPLGMIFATGGLGALAGAAAAPWLGRRLGAGGAMAAGLALAAVGSACVPLVGAAGWVGALLLVTQQVVGDGGHTIHAVHDRTLRQTAVAPALLARVDGGLRTLGQFATLAGALIGGEIGNRFGARTVLAICPLLLTLAAFWAWRQLARNTALPTK